MPKLRHKNSKSVEDYKATDLLGYWIIKYKKDRGEDYQSTGFRGYELSLLRKLREEIDDNYTILSAIGIAIDRGCWNIRFFCEKFDTYVPTTIEPRIFFFIEEKGEKEQRELYDDLSMHATRWMKDAYDEQKIREIKQELEDWIEGLL